MPLSKGEDSITGALKELEEEVGIKATAKERYKMYRDKIALYTR